MKPKIKADGKNYREKVKEILGHNLPEGACVHHHNGDRNDNENNNLVVCENNAYHKLLHQRTRAYASSGHANHVLCNSCKNYVAPDKIVKTSHNIKTCEDCQLTSDRKKELNRLKAKHKKSIRLKNIIFPLIDKCVLRFGSLQKTAEYSGVDLARLSKSSRGLIDMSDNEIGRLEKTLSKDDSELIQLRSFGRSNGVKMERNLKLKFAILEKYGTQTEFMKVCGIRSQLISGAISGRMVLRDSEKETIAAALSLPVEELFS